jgi:hypothetical protein
MMRLLNRPRAWGWSITMFSCSNRCLAVVIDV